MAFYGNFCESQWPPYCYDPNSYPTQSLISYLDYQPQISEINYYIASSSQSTSAPDDDVFEEYDPDPYSGGYDIVQTYGKPLPPSNQTCYPRSAPDSEGMPFETGAAAVVAAAEGANKGGNESAWESQSGNDASRYYGSGLEGVDLCGGVFGYWPCWEKHQKKGNNFGQEMCNSSIHGDDDSPWNNCKSAADYLFGSPFGYGELSYNYQQEEY